VTNSEAKQDDEAGVKQQIAATTVPMMLFLRSLFASMVC